MKKKLATLVCDKDLTITSCSDNFSAIAASSQESLVGRSLFDNFFSYYNNQGAFYGETEHPFRRALDRGEDVVGDHIGISTNDSEKIFWCMVNVKLDCDASGEVSRLYITYIPENFKKEKRNGDRYFRRKEDNLIRQTKDEWEKTFDAIHDVITILDTDLRIVRANKAAHDLCQLEYGELTGKRCYEVFEDRDEKCPHCPITRENGNYEALSGISYNNKFSKTFDISSAPILDEAGKIKLLVHTARDVTWQKEGEAERNLLSQAIEQASEAIVITDAIGNIQYVNPAFSRTTGYSRSEVIGKNPRILKSGYHDGEFYQEIWNTLLDGKVWSGRLVNKKKNDSLFHEDVNISPVSDFEGKITNFIAVKRDVSKEELLEKQLQQALKMEAIGTLAGGIAHDFNNILAAMIGYGQIAKARLKKEDPARADIDQILAAGDRAVDLVKQILTFSRKGEQKSLQLFKVQTLLKEVILLMRSSLPATIDLVFDIDNECGPVLADSNQLHQVLMNLFTNAIQSIGEEYGKIEVILREINVSSEEDSHGGLLLKPGRYLDLEVTDSGCGMDKYTQRRIFDPFFSTKSKDHGTGLGLAVVHGIVKIHGGEITVNSKVEQGARFNVYLPISDVTDIPHACKNGQPLFTGNERIMVVDDEEVVAKVISNMLSKMGYKTTIFTSSIEAVSTFRNNPQEYDLIFTDMTMPEMTGAELAWEMLSLRPDIPVILATGYSASIDKKKSERLGIKEFIMKPIKRKHLSKVVRKVLDNG